MTFRLALVALAINFLLPFSAQASDTLRIQQLVEQIAQQKDAGQIDLYLELSALYGHDDPLKAYEAAERASSLAGQYFRPKKQLLAQVRMGEWSLWISQQADRGYNQLVEVIEKSQWRNNPTIEGLAWMKMAFYYDNANLMQAMDSCIEKAAALAVYSDDDELKGDIAYYRGIWNYQQYKNEAAEEKFTAALRHYEKISYTAGICLAKLSLSSLIARRREFQQFLAILDTAQEIASSGHSQTWSLNLGAQTAIFRSYLAQDSAEQNRLGKEIAEWEEKIKKCPSDFVKLWFYQLRSKNLKDQGLADEALSYSEEYLRFSKALSFKRGIIKAHCYLQEIYFDIGKNDVGMEHVLAAKSVAEKVDFRVARIYIMISHAYRINKEYEKALEYRIRAADYDRVNNVKQSPFDPYFDYIDFSRLYLLVDSLDLSLTYADSALAYSKAKLTDKEVLKSSIYRGRALFALGRIKEAEQAFLEAKGFSANFQWSLNHDELSSLNYLGCQIYFKKRDYKKSIEHGELALKIAQKAKFKTVQLELHELLWKGNKGLGNYKTAMHHLESFKGLNDSIFQAESQARLITLKTQFEADEQAHKIELLQRDNDISALELVRQKSSLESSRFLLGLVVAIFGILLLGALLLFNRFKLRKRARELELKNRQLLLEEENRRSAQQLEMMNLRSSFFTQVSHEIRTPLTLIKGPLELLKKNPSTLQPQLIESMEHNADRLMSLVNQAMRYARVDDISEDFEPQPMLMKKFLERIHTSFAPLAREKNIAFKLDIQSENISCQIDPVQMEKAVSNLLSNAFRYTSSGGIIELTLSENDQGTHAIISVKDNGEGIAPEHLPHLFERYYRADSDLSTGFGVGLSIVKEVMEEHQGSVRVESKPGRGSIFTLSLQAIVQPAKEPEVQEPYTEPSEIGKPTVLVVEDNEEIRQFLIQILSTDYQVVSARDGLEGETQAIAQQPQVIITDVMMPGQDGFALVDRLKNNLSTSHISIIMLTAKASHSAKIQGLSVGADDYLYKPVSPDELLLKINNLLKQRDRIRSLFNESPETVFEETGGVSPMDVAFLKKANELVERFLIEEDFSTSRFCEELALNRTSVHHKLKALTGKNTSGFIKSVRIQKAVSLMREGNMHLQDVAERTGFSNRHTFTRAFKEEMGKTPSAFRAELEAMGQPTPPVSDLRGN